MSSFSFPVFRSLRDGKLGNWPEVPQSKSLRVSRTPAEFHEAEDTVSDLPPRDEVDPPLRPVATRRSCRRDRPLAISRLYQPVPGALDDLVEVLYRLLVETPEERPEPAAARESAPWELPCLPARREG